jgi:hypothetical protein
MDAAQRQRSPGQRSWLGCIVLLGAFMFNRDQQFIHLVLQLSADHDPEGYPAIKMKDLMRASEAIKSLSHIVEMDCHNWAECHTHVEKYYLSHFGIPHEHMCIEEMVDKLIGLIPAPNVQDHPASEAGSGASSC